MLAVVIGQKPSATPCRKNVEQSVVVKLVLSVLKPSFFHVRRINESAIIRAVVNLQRIERASFEESDARSQGPNLIKVNGDVFPAPVALVFRHAAVEIPIERSAVLHVYPKGPIQIVLRRLSQHGTDVFRRRLKLGNTPTQSVVTQCRTPKSGYTWVFFDKDETVAKICRQQR